MHIKTGDNVKVLSGREKGKTGKVIQVINDKESGRSYVVVENLNLRKKHFRPRQKNEKGQVIELAAPIDASNVMVIDPKSNKPTRVGYTIEGDSKKRVAKKSGEFID